MDLLGTALDDTDTNHRPNGTVYNAATRSYRNTFNLATLGGGAANNLVAADVRSGVKVIAVIMQSDANLSAVNFTIGTDTAPAKYGAAQAGPNATEKRFLIPIAALEGEALDAAERIKFFPSAALPAAGKIVTRIVATKR